VFTKRRDEQDETHQKTISLLVSKKTSLLASVARLEELEIGMLTTSVAFLSNYVIYLETQEKDELLQAERVKGLESYSSELSMQPQEALIRERDLAEKSRYQVSNIVLTRVPHLNFFRKESYNFSRGANRN
jgi:hypothetical protein